MAWQAAGDLTKFKAVTLDANGQGRVTFAVAHANQRWTVTGVVVTTSQGNQVPIPDVAVHQAFDGQQLFDDASVFGRSYAGQQQTFTGDITMDDGQDLTVQVGGQIAGIPGTVAKVKLSGQIDVWR